MKKLTFSTALLSLFLTVAAQAETAVALTSGKRLLFFDSATPGTVTKTITISTVGNEALMAIDFRPATGNLYALGASGRFYILNLTTGAASVPPGSPQSLSGASFGFDFNPTSDRIRVTSDADQNFRADPDDGTLAGGDNNFAYAAGDIHAGANPNIVASAYTNNFVGAGATVLYDIDSTQDTLVIQNPPNMGVLSTVGPLGVDTSDQVGFDISQGTGVAYASLTVGAVGQLYQISLANGAATLVGNIGNAGSLAGETVVGLAVPTPTRLLNIAARGRVGLGDDVLIGGFINRGGGRVLVRAIGPSLGAFGVSDFLPDPVAHLARHQRNCAGHQRRLAEFARRGHYRHRPGADQHRRVGDPHFVDGRQLHGRCIGQRDGHRSRPRGDLSAAVVAADQSLGSNGVCDLCRAGVLCRVLSRRAGPRTPLCRTVIGASKGTGPNV